VIGSARRPSERAQLAALCALIVVATFPAWTGGWVYDDWLMLKNQSMDGAEDLPAAFGRSSADYLGLNAATYAGAVTYRPLSMLSLIAVQAFAPEAPLLHHACSLALHLASVWLLFRTLRASAGALVARLGALTFGLHPLGVEAYGWINGRSDVLAGFGIALLAWTLLGVAARTQQGAESPLPAQHAGEPRVWLAGLGALIAGLSKETALLAALGTALAALFPPGRTRTLRELRQARRAPVLAAVAGVAIALTARRAALFDMGSTLESLSHLQDLPRALLRLGAVALGSVLVPAPRTMLNLGYELARPASAPELALLVAFGALLLWLACTRRLRAGLLLATAALMIVPCVLVRHTFWLGCDRYLYIPLLLSCLALGAPALDAWIADRLRPAARGAMASAWLLSLALSTFWTSRTYHGQTEQMLAMIHERPDDPTGPLVGARWLWHAGNREGARTLIDRVPRSGLAPPLASQLATRLGEMGRTDEALAVVADMARGHPDDPYVQLDVLAVELDQGELAAAAKQAQRLRQHPGFCRAARALIAQHLRGPSWSAAQRREGSALLAGYSCR
jgi:hypothetical protein